MTVRPHAEYGTDAVIELNELPIAVTRAVERSSGYRNLVLVDSSKAEAPRPLYAISPNNGRFVEHYRTLRSQGDAYVYTVVQGFALPKLEVFSAGVLDDEITPSRIQYGYDYHVTVRYAKGSGPWANVLATLNNRIGANMFKQGGAQILSLWSDPKPESELSGRYHYEQLHYPHIQARDIGDLPPLAERILPTRPVPWAENPTPASPSVNRLRSPQDRLQFLPPHPGPLPGRGHHSPRFDKPSVSDRSIRGLRIPLLGERAG